MQCPPLIKLARFIVAILLFSPWVTSLAGQTSDAQASESQSWTKTTESHSANMNPTRTTESHQKSANGTVDHQIVERLGPDGHYEPYYDIERQSVQVNGTTTRTIERTFARDASGQQILTRVTEEIELAGDADRPGAVVVGVAVRQRRPARARAEPGDEPFAEFRARQAVGHEDDCDDGDARDSLPR